MSEVRSPSSRVLQRLPLHAFHVFEAAARHASFRLAARELGLTPSAVSHQVRGLETALGMRLFERAPRRVTLTNAGGVLYGATRRAFDELEEVVRELLLPAGGDGVAVSTTPAFAARWLIPRLAAFESAHPEVRVRLVSTNDVTPLGGGSDVDLAIRYGEPAEPHLETEALLDERFIAVATPAYARRVEGGSRATLLHVAWRSDRFKRVTWSRFLAQDSGRALASVVDGAAFEDESHAVLAAVSGQGVALVSDLLVAELLVAKTLVRVGETSLPGYRYHLVARRDQLRREPVAAFAAWLREAARASTTMRSGASDPKKGSRRRRRAGDA